MGRAGLCIFKFRAFTKSGSNGLGLLKFAVRARAFGLEPEPDPSLYGKAFRQFLRGSGGAVVEEGIKCCWGQRDLSKGLFLVMSRAFSEITDLTLTGSFFIGHPTDHRHSALIGTARV